MQLTPIMRYDFALRNTGLTIYISYEPIKTPQDLQDIRFNQRGNFIICNHIDMKGFSFEPIPEFSGVLSGSTCEGGCKISNLLIQGQEEEVGLFAKNRGRITQVNLVNVEVGGGGSRWNRTGAFAGLNYGVIHQSSVTGLVRGTGAFPSTAGMLAGGNYGVIEQSYAQGVVQGPARLAGLTGWNYIDRDNGMAGIVSQSYAHVHVQGGDTCVSGLVGLVGAGSHAPGIVTESYSTGRVSTGARSGGLIACLAGAGRVEKSFWDVETSAQNTSDGGIGRRTAIMKEPENYIRAGWDANVWIFERGEYPKLAWQK